MRYLVGLDDTDSSRGYCTTYLAFRIATDLRADLKVLPYPRLVRLNPNIPFKTRGNAAVCLRIETEDPERAFERLCSKVEELSDVDGGANTGLVYLQAEACAPDFERLYLDALSGLVNPHRVRSLLREKGVRSMTLGNGMGLVGAAASVAFDERFDHTYELISYRRPVAWGRKRLLDPASVKELDGATFPHTYNNYDGQKRKVLVAPHGPDPVFAGIRGDTPEAVLAAFSLLRHAEELEGQMVYVSNQHTDAHLQRQLDWKVFSSGWCDGTVEKVEVGAGGHLYATLSSEGALRQIAFYEPTGDLRRAAMLLRHGDRVRVFGGVRKATSKHPKVLNVEKMQVIRPKGGPLVPGTYVSSPRANRHLTKPLIRYGNEVPGKASAEVGGWLAGQPTQLRALARSP